MLNIKIKEPKLLFIKVVIIFVPVFSVAYFTQNMIFILPTLAGGMLFGTSLSDTSNTENSDGSSDEAEMDSDTSD
tara:strand:- start:92 stop:316 length:225 start_codon:yes stop_codon:yes gene_type:complete